MTRGRSNPAKEVLDSAWNAANGIALDPNAGYLARRAYTSASAFEQPNGDIRYINALKRSKRLEAAIRRTQGIDRTALVLLKTACDYDPRVPSEFYDMPRGKRKLDDARYGWEAILRSRETPSTDYGFNIGRPIRIEPAVFELPEAGSVVFSGFEIRSRETSPRRGGVDTILKFNPGVHDRREGETITPGYIGFRDDAGTGERMAHTHDAAIRYRISGGVISLLGLRADEDGGLSLAPEPLEDQGLAIELLTDTLSTMTAQVTNASL